MKKNQNKPSGYVHSIGGKVVADPLGETFMTPRQIVQAKSMAKLKAALATEKELQKQKGS